MVTWTKICCRKGGGCPQVKMDGDTLHIKDDLGGISQLTVSEFKDIYRWLQKGNGAQAQKTPEHDGST